MVRGYPRPVFLIILINLMAYSLLYFYQDPPDAGILISGAAMIGIVFFSYVLIIRGRFEDEIIFLIVSMLTSLGLIMLHRLDPALGDKQLIWFALGTFLLFAAAYFYRTYHIWPRLVYLYPALAIFLFLMTLIFGSTINGATNWILLGPFGFQPSEIVKLIFILFIAAYLDQPEKLALKNLRIKGKAIRISGKQVFTCLVYLQMLFLVLQRELGTLVLFYLIFMMMMYVYDHDWKYLLFNLGLSLMGGITGMIFLHHVQVRIEAWLHPWADTAGKGYQITQSLFGIGAGGFFGTGLGLGQPQFIPEVQTDFIFSAICEEMGIFGGMAIVLLFFILVYRGMKITLKLQDRFHQAVSFGITVMYGFQAFIIIGGVIRLIPLTGITLPFLSYGGSSLVTNFMALGILQAVSSKIAGEEVADGRKAADASE